MELNPDQLQSSAAYLSLFEPLIGDVRTQKTFTGIVHGIIGSESLRASRIARFSP